MLRNRSSLVMEKGVKTAMSVLGVFFGVSIVLQSLVQLGDDFTAGANAGAITGEILLLVTGFMVLLISATFLYRTYIKKPKT